MGVELEPCGQGQSTDRVAGYYFNSGPRVVKTPIKTFTATDFPASSAGRNFQLARVSIAALEASSGARRARNPLRTPASSMVPAMKIL